MGDTFVYVLLSLIIVISLWPLFAITTADLREIQLPKRLYRVEIYARKCLNFPSRDLGSDFKSSH